MQEVSKDILTGELAEGYELVYASGNSSVFQCDDRDIFLLRFFRQEIELRLCELLAFRRKIRNVNMHDLLSTENADMEIVALPNCDRIFAFTIMDILELRELFDGCLTMLELNSVIHRHLVRNLV